MSQQLREIWTALDGYGRPLGLEVTPFKVGWYNGALRDGRFAFDVHEDTLAFVVVSAPSMFERAFLPYVRGDVEGREDPLDECMRHHFRAMCRLFPESHRVEPMHDFEMASPVSKRPKVLVQTAAHVASVARQAYLFYLGQALFFGHFFGG